MVDRIEESDPNQEQERERLRTATPKEEEGLTVEDALLASLDPLIEDHLLLEVVRPIKSGKEAAVYLCRADPSLGQDLVAAKIFRPYERRSFRRDGVYQQGRERGARPDAREMRAHSQKTPGGRLRKFDAWISHEMKTLELLHNAGGDVPEPFVHHGPVILMEYIGDRDHPAPVLVNQPIEAADAARLYAVILRNVELFLTHHRVHADLSAFNILLWEEKATIIDFPQAVDPRYNDDAFDLLVRDLKNTNEFFADRGVEVVDPIGHALTIWRKHVDRNR
ncbi:MAG: RIO1 family regulatory kinase/ATPase [Candidatus Bipolaricaulia bacterium]